MARVEKIDLSADEVRRLLDYDPETGIFRWRRNPERAKNWNSRRAGKVAGYSMSSGYVQIRIEGHGLYLSHRLAWLHVTGDWPRQHVDHKNGDPADNRFCNLREATRTQNMRNMRMHADNQCGFLGVRFRPHHGKYEARIHRGGTLVWRGYFETAQEAAAARRAQTEVLDGEFASHHAAFGP